MNFYNPYYIAPNNFVRPGLFSALRNSGFSFSSLLNGTQKTLGIINQAIPIVKQVSPVVKNAKTMFKVMNEFKKEDESGKNNNMNDTINSEVITSSNYSGPTFFA